MDQDQGRPEEWIERAVEQAIALRETVLGEPGLRDLIDAVLFELATRIADDLNNRG